MVSGIKVGEKVKSGAKSYVKGNVSSQVPQKKTKAQTSHGSRENTHNGQLVY